MNIFSKQEIDNSNKNNNVNVYCDNVIIINNAHKNSVSKLNKREILLLLGGIIELLRKFDLSWEDIFSWIRSFFS